jgi:HEAT repeat protein
MPDAPGAEMLAQYKATTIWFYNHPDPACIPLFLNSFGEWRDWSLYDSVQAVIQQYSREEVLPHLVAGCSSKNEAIRLWCADTARLFPDEALIEPLAELLKETRIDMRLVAAAALECIDSPKTKDIAAAAIAGETDEEVRDILQMIIES